MSDQNPLNTAQEHLLTCYHLNGFKVCLKIDDLNKSWARFS